MGKPSEEEYIKAKENLEFLRDLITTSNERIMQLVDKLAEERDSLNRYENLLDQNRLIILRYDFCEEMEGKENGTE